MIATRRTTGAPRRSLISIFDEAGVLNAPTPATPLVNAAPAANSAAAAFLENCRRLRRELFDASVAKYVLRKVVNDKSMKFRGTEVRAGDLWARLVTELRLAFINEDSGFSSLFDLADATLPVRSEANGLLFSALANLVNPESPAGDWLDSSGAHFPDDGKRALLEVIRRLYDNLWAAHDVSEGTPSPRSYIRGRVCARVCAVWSGALGRDSGKARREGLRRTRQNLAFGKLAKNVCNSRAR
ncbi:hypothetical protein CYMTET_5056 [Cymbomonas tetramitiformis]|uniref:Uncharacterized protein n=1 Tax=Cymbomonas tetramitiformis TaxID=36881 RepID=A0AAE0H1S9_9CHLO|nr:hypothetical protein CYMTET_5056 [Cymbomonas tetramitiformis]